MSWRNRPTYKHYWNDSIDYILFIDESGDPSLKYVQKCIKNNKSISDNKFFTITGCLMKREDFLTAKKNILNLKYKHWNNGLAMYKKYNALKRVCFHSHEIRGRKPPFDNNTIKYDEFVIDLSEYMKNIPIDIFSYTIDKEKHCLRYTEPYHPYSLGLEFILERLVKYSLKPNESAIIVIEGRGKKEDKELLNHIKDIMDKGTRYVGENYFNVIKGVYFNPKWSKEDDDKKTYFGLEIADLICYPIHKYCKSNFTNKDKAFLSIEDKIYGYPDYKGKGIKVFP